MKKQSTVRGQETVSKEDEDTDKKKMAAWILSRQRCMKLNSYPESQHISLQRIMQHFAKTLQRRPEHLNCLQTGAG